MTIMMEGESARRIQPVYRRRFHADLDRLGIGKVEVRANKIHGQGEFGIVCEGEPEALRHADSGHIIFSAHRKLVGCDRAIIIAQQRKDTVDAFLTGLRLQWIRAAPAGG